MDEFPNRLQQFIVKVVDVRLDGNCRYKAITILLGQRKESWALVRQDLIRELQTWNSQYFELFGT